MPGELVFSLRLRLLILKLNLDLGLAAAAGGGGVDAAVVVALEATGLGEAVGGIDSSSAAAAAEMGEAEGGGSGGESVALIASNGSTTDALPSPFGLDASICAWVGITGNFVEDCLLLPSSSLDDDVEWCSPMLFKMLEGDTMFRGGDAAAAESMASCSSCSVASVTGDEAALPWGEDVGDSERSTKVRLPEGAIKVLLCDLNRRLISLGVALLPAELLLLTLPAVPFALPGVAGGGLLTGLGTLLLLPTAVNSGDVFSLAGTLGPVGREGSKK